MLKRATRGEQSDEGETRVRRPSDCKHRGVGRRQKKDASALGAGPTILFAVADVRLSGGASVVSFQHGNRSWVFDASLSISAISWTSVEPSLAGP